MSELEDFIKNNAEGFDNRVPDPAVLERIQQQMRGVIKKKERTIVLSMRVVLRVAACLVLLASAATFWLMKKEPVRTETAAVVKNTPDTQTVVKDQPENKELVAAALPKKPRTEAVDQELAQRKEILFAKLNDMGSASQRYAAATQANTLKNTDNDIVDALVSSMNNDPSTNVRLAALEALSKFYREAYVKKQLIASLKKQKDPMVQIELIQLLTKMKERSILQELDKLVNDGSTMEAVKENAYTGIFKLRS